MEKTKRPFKQINVGENNWHKYNNAAIQLSVKRGNRVSIPALLDEAFNKYLESL